MRTAIAILLLLCSFCQAEPKVPESQRKFVQASESFKKIFIEKNKEYLKFSFIEKRESELMKALTGRTKVSNWIGTITDVGIDNDTRFGKGSGKAYIAIKLLDSDVIIKTPRFGDREDTKLIGNMYGRKLFEVVSKMKVGQRVVFSGQFQLNRSGNLPTEPMRGFAERRANMGKSEIVFRNEYEEKIMTSMRFILKFSDVARVK